MEAGEANQLGGTAGYAQRRRMLLGYVRSVRGLEAWRWWRQEDRTANIRLIQRHMVAVRNWHRAALATGETSPEKGTQ